MQILETFEVEEQFLVEEVCKGCVQILEKKFEVCNSGVQFLVEEVCKCWLQILN